jgi:type II secretory pathway pseudopilin PulG
MHPAPKHFRRWVHPNKVMSPRAWRVALLVIGASLATVVVLTLTYSVRGTLRNAACANNLHQIALALQSYHAQTGAFPPAFLCDTAGKPLNSWRLAIVPGRLWYTFPDAYDFGRPWDSPQNAKLLRSENEKATHHFQCPNGKSKDSAVTNYVAVIGPNTMWRGCEGVTMAPDGSNNDKILVIEWRESDILWMEPRDLTLDQALDALLSENNGIGDRHPLHYVTVGGEVRTIDHALDRRSLRSLFERGRPDVRETK